MLAAGNLGCFIPGEDISVVFCNFLAGSLVDFKETHVLGGEVYGPKLSAAVALHQVLIVSAENCLHVSRVEAGISVPSRTDRIHLGLVAN